MAPPYLIISGHRVPLDIPLLVIGFVLTFYAQQVATFLLLAEVYVPNVKLIGELALFLGAAFFIFGRIELRS